eukprot:1416815-Alexandrium_andersonii.AAC.1
MWRGRSRLGCRTVSAQGGGTSCEAVPATAQRRSPLRQPTGERSTGASWVPHSDGGRARAGARP